MADISRRTLLSRAALVGGVVVGAGFGFGRHVHHKVAVPPPAPPAELTSALARQQALLAGYNRIGSAPASLKSDVTAHGAAIRALLELYPGWRLARQPRPGSSSAAVGPAPASGVSSPSASPSGAGAAIPADIGQLARSSLALARSLATTATGWPASEPNAAQVVPTLASISAALTTHAGVLA